MKTYYIQNNIGKCKYVVNFWDGNSTYHDGSKFFDIKIFKSKFKMGLFVKQLLAAGYTEK